MKYINQIKYFFNKTSNKKKFSLFIMIIISILVIAGTSYAYISFNLIGKEDNLIKAGCLQYTISDFNNISIDDGFSMSDKEGLNSVPYVYSITNTCTTEAYYETNIGIVNTSNINNISNVKIALSGDTYLEPTLISDFYESVITGVDSDISNTYLIDDGYLKEGETKTFNLRMWIDYDATSFSGTLDSKIIINGISKKGPNFDSYTAGYKVFKTSQEINKTSNNPNYSYIAPYTDSNNVYSQTSGLLEIISDSSKDYYFRGSPIDNYISFAGMNWRIVKINNDGSLKLILEDDISLTSVYKSTSTEEDLNYSNSTLKSTLDTWYTSNLSSYDSYIKSEDYCLDSNAYSRNITNSKPDGITCSSSISSKIGGLTADDIAYAGGKYNTSNNNYYLYKNYKWWTISYGNYSENAYEIIVDSNGSINTNILTDSLYVRPVITLSANAILSGSGTSSDKYIVTGLVTDEVLTTDITPPSITFARSTEGNKIEVSASDDTTVAGIYISTSNTTPETSDSNWIAYSSEKYISDVYDKGIYYIWVKDKNNNISGFKTIAVGNIYIYNKIKDQVNTSITPNFNYISNYNTNNINTNDNGVFLYDGTDDNNGDKDIYYYRGNVTNNNVLFGGFCWKIVRTTSTGGIKMIYNGTPKTEYTNLTILERNNYANIINVSSSPFTFDSTTNKWTSGAIGNSSSTEISFSVKKEGIYFLEYDVSSESGYDYVRIYKDGVEIKAASGTNTEQVSLGELTSSNVIKVKYSKDRGTVSGRDNVIFNIKKTTDSSISYIDCNNLYENSHISYTSYNSNPNTPSAVGYMYGTTYNYSSKAMTPIFNHNTASTTILTSKGSMDSTSYYYFNDSSFSGGEAISWSSNYADIVGKWTCFNSNSSSCTTPYYIAGSTSSTAYYNSSGKSAITVSSGVTYSDNLYTLTDTNSVDLKDYYTNYADYKNKYFCTDLTSSSCSSVYYNISSTSSTITRVTFANGETYENVTTQNIVYGNDVTYENGVYTLIDTTSSIVTKWSSDRSTLAKNRHYTCFNTTGTCSMVYYITYFGSSSSVNYLTFTSGDTLDTAKDKMYTNTNDSTIKIKIDTWYKNNLIKKSSYLENTIFCNDRTLYSGPLHSKDTYSLDYSYYKPVQRLSGTLSLTCSNKNDRFSLSMDNGGTYNYGNNTLTYPIGLITSDEIRMAGGGGKSNTDFYLYNATTFWTLSSSYWCYDTSDILFFGSNFGYNGYVSRGLGVRPVISLKNNVTLNGGSGAYTDPYLVG